MLSANPNPPIIKNVAASSMTAEKAETSFVFKYPPYEIIQNMEMLTLIGNDRQLASVETLSTDYISIWIQFTEIH